MRMFFCYRPVAMLLAGLCACSAYAAPQSVAGQSGPANANSKPQPTFKPAPKTPQQQQGIKIGENIQLTHMQSTHFGQQAGELVFDGPDMQLESINKTRGTNIVVIVDHAVVHQRPNNRSTADLTGNARYTLTEQTQDGKQRIIKGTAQRAYYTEANKGLRLLGGVNATLTDPSRFDAPATLRVTTLNMPGEGRFELTGDPTTTDVRFTPHTAPPKIAPKPDATNTTANLRTLSRVGVVHVTGFRTGNLNKNENADFTGPLVTVETNNPQAKTRNTFKAPHITAILEEAKQRIDAQGGIQFDTQATDAKGNTQRLEGTAGTAFWEEASAVLEADGNITAKLTNPVTLKEPATLIAGHLTATLGDEPRYVLTGAPERNRLALNPRPNPAKAKKDKSKAANPATPQATPVTLIAPAQQDAKSTPKGVVIEQPGSELDPPDLSATDPTPNAQRPTSNAPFAFGSLVVSGFKSATYAPGENMVVEGPKIHFTSTNPDTRNFAELYSPYLTAEFDEDNTITSAKATGGVTYKFELPLKEHKELQWISGDGQDVAFTNTEQARNIQVEGGKTLAYYNPVYFPDVTHTIFHENDGVGTYNLVTGEVLIESKSKSYEMTFTTYAPPQTKHTVDPKKKPKRK